MKKTTLVAILACALSACNTPTSQPASVPHENNARETLVSNMKMNRDNLRNSEKWLKVLELKGLDSTSESYQKEFSTYSVEIAYYKLLLQIDSMKLAAADPFLYRDLEYKRDSLYGIVVKNWGHGG